MIYSEKTLQRANRKMEMEDSMKERKDLREALDPVMVKLSQRLYPVLQVDIAIHTAVHVADMVKLTSL